MEQLFNETGVIVSFLFLVLALEMMAGDELTQMFLYLVLFSMVILNSDRVISVLERSFSQ